MAKAKTYVASIGKHYDLEHIINEEGLLVMNKKYLLGYACWFLEQDLLAKPGDKIRFSNHPFDGCKEIHKISNDEYLPDYMSSEITITTKFDLCSAALIQLFGRVPDSIYFTVNKKGENNAL